MSTLDITIKQPARSPKKVLVEIGADRFERLAADLGFFNPDFLESLDRAERDYKAGRVTRLKSLKQLRSKKS